MAHHTFFYSDFPQHHKRHYEDKNDASLHGSMLMPSEADLEAEAAARRQLASTAYAVSTSQQGPNTTATWISTQMAESQGYTLAAEERAAKARRGKRCMAPPGSVGGPAAMSSMHSAYGLQMQPGIMQNTADLQEGTCKQSQHLPGYAGHIPTVSALAQAPVPTRSMNKDLVLENFRTPNAAVGYTGRRK